MAVGGRLQSGRTPVLVSVLLGILLFVAIVGSFLVVTDRTYLLRRLPGWPAPAPAVTAVLAGKVLPSADGVYWGAFLPRADLDHSVVSSFRSDVGRTPAIVSIYQQWWGEPSFPTATAKWLRGRGSVPLIVWEPWRPGQVGRAATNQPDYALAAIAAGRLDGYVRRYADQVKAYAGPLFLEPLHEMNGNWYPWGGTVNGNTPSDYVAAWRHLYAIFQEEGATNVTWTWTTNRDSVPNTAGNQPAGYWPGAGYVDWVGLDAYNWGTAQGKQWWSVEQTFGAGLDWLRQLGKPIIVAETACAEVGGDKAGWIDTLFETLTGAYRDLVDAVVWFDEPFGVFDWRTNSSPAAQAAFKMGVARPGLLAAGHLVVSAPNA